MKEGNQVLNPDVLNEIVNRLRDSFHPERIILFGSQAIGDANKDSDIDILVVADTVLPPDKRFPAASRALRGLPYAFDVIVKTPQEYERWRRVVNHIVYFVDKYGRVVYEQ
jgi:predicted nucleotidyltransferase